MPAADGSAQLRALAVRLRAAGESAWLRTMTAEMRAFMRANLVPAARESARTRLPHTGGLNERVANERITASVRTGPRTAGARMFMRDHDSKTTNAGYVRHPVFGTWRPGLESQAIPEAEGWWTDPLEERSPQVTPQLLEVMQRVAAAIQGRGL